MLDLSFVREHLDLVRRKLEERNAGPLLGAFADLDARRRALLKEADGLKQSRNQANEEITRLKKSGADASGIIGEMKNLAEKIKTFDTELKGIHEKLEEILMGIPNLPHDSVPIGADASANTVVRVEGAPPKFD